MDILHARHRYRVDRTPMAEEDAEDPARARRGFITTERRHIHTLLRDGRITDEARRRMERELDLEEAVLAAHEGVERDG